MRVECMESDVDAIVAGFISGEGFPFSYGFLQGVVSGIEVLRILTCFSCFLEHTAHVKDRGFRRRNAVFDADVV